MRIRNVHERVIAAPVERVGALLDRLGGPDDVLWPPEWPPMVLDGPVAPGAAGGHGGLRYRVTGHVPGRRIVFTVDPDQGLRGDHTFTAEPAGSGRTVLRHEIGGRATGVMRLLWPVAVRPAHDAVVERILDHAATAAGDPPRRPARASVRARLVRRSVAGRARPAPVPDTPLLAAALPRVDFADAYAVPVRPGLPVDPQVWADALFRDPPAWVTGLLGLRESLVGMVGIARGGVGSFDTVARTGDEVLLGTDERHLDFRASVLREDGRVVVTTVVALHGARGRAYFALVRLLHPTVVRAMLGRAAHRLALGGPHVTRM
ncbi:DUF2867 domain-containing protein [Pseudonocardia sp. NPDC046786]|uniref:DUF2867 domain-containing protein n=1 Tax=Pseudonocardia sp. NPDC046786 TaxID=3155471 RepID=UPI0034112AAD